MEDCFAYKHNGCIALKVIKCEGCSFYKTKEQHQLDQQKALERIYALDADKQGLHILKPTTVANWRCCNMNAKEYLIPSFVA
jgi:hypothetical protein